mmetsp:Transcript_1923/g.3847  ORF Transcript_1923/g.3847 Transcript_1923/m.3847 type:complete len:81 (+) Transcript_1923:562-804(+)
MQPEPMNWVIRRRDRMYMVVVEEEELGRKEREYRKKSMKEVDWTKPPRRIVLEGPNQSAIKPGNHVRNPIQKQAVEMLSS